jgi:hypothetical protein
MVVRRSIGPASGLLLNFSVGDQFSGPITQPKRVGAGEQIIGQHTQAVAADALVSSMTEEAPALLGQRAVQMGI